MGSETNMMKLPVIDFTNVNQLETPTQVKEALEEYGCFEAVFDQIPLHLRKSLFDELIHLFDLPLENKLRNKSDKPYHGHLMVKQGDQLPTYESLAINDALSPQAVENFTNLMWSQGNPHFRESMESYIEQLSKLDKTVRRMVLEGLGLEKYMDKHMELDEYLVRVQKYNKNEIDMSDEGKTVFSSHTDENTLTIVYQNEVNGLEVQKKDGHWITLDLSPDSFVVLVGGAFHAWTNGRLHVPYHRVLMRSEDKAARYSIALFSNPKAGHLIQAPEELVDEEHPLLFKPYEYIEYLDFAFNFEAGPATLSALQDFCGLV